VETHNPEAFVSVEEVRSVHQGVFRTTQSPYVFAGRAIFPLWRK